MIDARHYDDQTGATMWNMPLDSSTSVAVSELIQALSEYATLVEFRDSRTLFRQGDSPVGVFVVQSGNVVLTMKDTVGKILLRMSAQPGSVLGLPAVIGNFHYSLSAEAARDAQVSFVPHKEFMSLMLTHPELAVKVLQVLAAELRAAGSMIAA